jgi:hypothetical protein
MMGTGFLFFLINCRRNTGPESASGGSRPRVMPAARPAPVKTAPRTQSDDLATKLSEMLNEKSIRYGSLEYEYDENLLTTIDKAEAYLSGRLKGPAPRAMPKLSELEEYDHFRETIRRWRARTGKDLRAEIDRLKADVAARQPGGPAFHPDFHKKFAAVFDSFIPIEVQEIRERRNRAIHEAAKALFDEYRADAPDLVKEYEETLNSRPYALTPDTLRAPGAKPHAPPKS